MKSSVLVTSENTTLQEIIVKARLATRGRNRKKSRTGGLGSLHEFAADAVYPRRPRPLSDQMADTLSVDSQLDEIIVDAVPTVRRRKGNADLKRRPASRRNKGRTSRDR
jgi:hypothetical protein